MSAPILWKISCGSGPQDSPHQGTEPLHNCGPDLSPDEDEEDCPQVPPHPGELSSALDPLQFVNRPDIRVDEAFIYLSHLETSGDAVRLILFDFSHTIKLSLLRRKMEDAGVDQLRVAWTIDYVRLQSPATSHSVVCW